VTNSANLSVKADQAQASVSLPTGRTSLYSSHDAVSAVIRWCRVQATAAAWHDAAIADTLNWPDVRKRNIEVLEAVGEAGLQHAQLTGRDLGIAVEQWSFPLFDLDLRKRKVEQDELDGQFRRGEDQFYRDIYGTLDSPIES
jgi:hypothetical protein